MKRHLGASELVDLHLGESGGAAGARAARHLDACDRCRGTAADLAFVERALQPGPDQPPPRDGLARVMAALEQAPQPRSVVAPWLGAVTTSLAGVVAGAAAIAAAGTLLLAPALADRVPLDPVGAGLALAALGFFGLGSFATLALTPVLLLEARPGSGRH